MAKGLGSLPTSGLRAVPTELQFRSALLCGAPASALSLVVAVDMRDPPDVLQVKAHPVQLQLLPASDVHSCNTVPSQ